MQLVVQVRLAEPKHFQSETPIEGVAVRPKLLPLVSNVTKTAAAENIEGVTMKLGEGNENCLVKYLDNLHNNLDGWLVPRDKNSWSLGLFNGEKFISATPQQEQLPKRSISVLYLSRRPCQGGVGMRVSVRIRPTNDVRSGE